MRPPPGAMRFVLFSLCSAVTGQLLGSRKQSLKRALNSGPGSILPPDGILARDTTKVSCPSANKCTMVSPANAPGAVIVVAETVWGYGYSPITSATYFTYEEFVKLPFDQ